MMSLVRYTFTLQLLLCNVMLTVFLFHGALRTGAQWVDPGWCHGDLHCKTVLTSAAWASMIVQYGVQIPDGGDQLFYGTTSFFIVGPGYVHLT